MRNRILAIFVASYFFSCGLLSESNEKNINQHPSKQPAAEQRAAGGSNGENASAEEAADFALWGFGVADTEEILAKYDTDDDGKLSDEERKAAREAMKAECDTDDDGELTGEERKACMIKPFDKDGDGKLSEEEKAAFKEAWKKKMKERWSEFHAKCKEKRLEKYDKDGDGKLSDEEKQAWKDEWKAKMEEWKAKREEAHKTWCAQLQEIIDKSEDSRPLIERMIERRCKERSKKEGEKEEDGDNETTD